MKKFFIATLLTTSCLASSPSTQLGIDQIFQDPYAKLIKGQRIGLIANNASVNSSGVASIELFKNYPNAKLTAIFTPEHGLTVAKDEKYNDEHDAKIPIPIYSLYGKNREPTAEQLKNIDILVFDLRSVELRYYTYSATLGKIITTAAKYHKKVIVLDTINPLGGQVIAGPTLDPKLIGKFTSYFNIPIRYGLTMGELARYDNKYLHPTADLKVIPLKNWHRSMLFEATGQKWIPTSPALQTIQQVYLYSVFGPMESTNVSFGLGHADPTEFHYYGAPYISTTEAKKISTELTALHLPGLVFKPKTWIPLGKSFVGKKCQGIEVTITDFNQVKSFYSLISLLKTFHHVLGDKFKINGIHGMIGRNWVEKAIRHQVPTEEIVKKAEAEQKPYLQQRKSILLYQ